MFFEQQIRIIMISEEWSNDAENSVVNYILNYSFGQLYVTHASWQCGHAKAEQIGLAQLCWDLERTWCEIFEAIFLISSVGLVAEFSH